MITEITVEDGEIYLLKYRVVAVKDYGSEGCLPIYPETDCPLDDSVVSCVGSSGSNCCGGYMGHAAAHVVRCQEPLKETK